MKEFIKNIIKSLLTKNMERDHLEDVVVEGKVILKRFLRKCDWRS